MRLVLFTAAWFCVGCGGRYLRWKAQPAAANLAGKITVKVTDTREEKKGGRDKREVGWEPGAFAMPVPVRVSSEREVADSIGELVAQAARSSGFGVAVPSEVAPATVQVEVMRLWCAGFTYHFVANVDLGLSVVDAAGTMKIAASPVLVEDADTDCHGAYKKTLTKAFTQVAAFFTSNKKKLEAVTSKP